MPAAEPLHHRFERTHSYVLPLLRAAGWCHARRLPLLPWLIQAFIRVVFSADLPAGTQWPRDLILLHNGLGSAIHAEVVFEGPTLIGPGAMLGHRLAEPDGAPTLGAGAFIGNGAAVLGPFRVGRLSVVAAKALVTKDVPDRHIAMGVPARMVPMTDDQVASLAAFFRMDPEEGTG